MLVVGKGRRLVDEGREQVVGCGSCDERSIRHGEGASVDGSLHDGGCSLEEVGHGRSSRRMEGSRCCDGGVESVSGNGRCGGLRPGSGKMSKGSQAWFLVGDIHQLCSERWHL